MNLSSTPKSTIKVVAFDCDGVMFDTQATNRRFYNTLLESFKLPAMTEDQFRFVHMATVSQALDHLFKGKVSMEEAKKRAAAFDYEELIPHMVMEPHLISLLKSLAPHFKRAIATNRSNTMEPLMKAHGLTPFFELVVTSTDVKTPKPAPDQLHLIMNHFAVAPQEVLYIGDSPTDQMAAERAGVPFVAFGNPSLKAQTHMNRLDEVAQFLHLEKKG